MDDSLDEFVQHLRESNLPLMENLGQNLNPEETIEAFRKLAETRRRNLEALAHLDDIEDSEEIDRILADDERAESIWISSGSSAPITISSATDGQETETDGIKVQEILDMMSEVDAEKAKAVEARESEVWEITESQEDFKNVEEILNMMSESEDNAGSEVVIKNVDDREMVDISNVPECDISNPQREQTLESFEKPGVFVLSPGFSVIITSDTTDQVDEDIVARGERAERVQEAIMFLKKLKYDLKELDIVLEILKINAKEYGLSFDALCALTGFIAVYDLGFARMRTLMRCLVPEGFIPDEAVNNIMIWFMRNCFVSRKCSSVCLVLGWLTGVVEYRLANKHPIDTFYELFFYLMNYSRMSRMSCKLVFLLTKPQDVNRAKVQEVFRLHRNIEPSPYFPALLYLFKCYRPECVPEPINPPSLHSVFKRYSNFLVEIFKETSLRLKKTLSSKLESKILGNTGRKCKKRYKRLIPPIEYMSADSSFSEQNLFTMNDLQQLCMNHLFTKPPNNVLSLLSNRTGNYMLAFSEAIVQERFSYVLYYNLYDIFLECNPLVELSEKENFLERICSCEQFMQSGIPVVSRFLAQYLIRWDGRTHLSQITKLLSHITFETYDELRDCILTYLRTIFLTNPVSVRCNIIKILQEILTNLILHYKWALNDIKPRTFLNVKMNKSADVIMDLYNYAQNLNLTAVHLEPDGLSMHVVLNFYEQVFAAAVNANLRFCPINKFIVYFAFFSSNAVFVSRICGLIDNYRLVEAEVLRDIAATWDDEAFIEHSYSGLFQPRPEAITKLLQKYPDLNTSFNPREHSAFAPYVYGTLNAEQLENATPRLFLKLAKKYYPSYYYLMKKIKNLEK